MKRHPQMLPDVPIRHLLWTIPESFGGMTTVALRRASVLADIDRRRMDVLTLAPDFSPRVRQRELRREGLISKSVRIRNLWDELRHASDKSLARMSAGSLPDPHTDYERTPMKGRSDYEFTADNGDVLQIARFRAGGRLLLTDRQDVKVPGKRGGRRLTLYSRDGTPLGQWNSATAFYHAWLRFVSDAEESILICDSAFVGGLMHSFDSAHTSLIQVIHSHHLDDERSSLGTLARGKLPILKNADAYDLIAVLTERQKQDLLDENIVSDNAVAIANPFHGETSRDLDPRDRGRGIIVSRLSGIKRLDHAITAIASITSPSAPTLDIYGDGDSRNHLESHIADLGVDERVRLHGHDPNARSQFAHASFSLLTSRSEGQSLMVVESMASGCIPIAYDIAYGPSDIITDSVDGILVEAGQPDALAHAIDRFLDMDESRILEMRHAALETSKRFSADTIAAKWAHAFHRIVDQRVGGHQKRSQTVTPHLVTAELIDGSAVFSIRLDADDPQPGPWAKLALIGRADDAYTRVDLQSLTDDHGRALRGEVSIDRLALGSSGFLDLFLDTRIGGTRVRSRVSARTSTAPMPIGHLELYSTVHGNASIRRAE